MFSKMDDCTFFSYEGRMFGIGMATVAPQPEPLKKPLNRFNLLRFNISTVVPQSKPLKKLLNRFNLLRFNKR